MYERTQYLNELIQSIDNGMVKVITGPRRSGKSFLLFHIFKDHLLKNGIKEEQIVEINLEDNKNAVLRNPINLSEYINERLSDQKTFVLIDEIQLCIPINNPAFTKEMMPQGQEIPKITFYDVLNELCNKDNVETFVTGSNAFMLSDDIATEFRGRGWQIPMHPLTFSEYVGKEKDPSKLLEMWEIYFRYGGLPVCCDLPDIPSKRRYLSQIFETTYIKDIIERHSLKKNTVLREVTKVIASTSGSLVNFSNIANIFRSVERDKTITDKTIKLYLKYLEDAFVVSKVERYDVKGRQNIGGVMKYYMDDLGIRNAVLGFKEVDEEAHIMENVVYNELIARNYTVNVGVVNWKEVIDGKCSEKNAEVDFVAQKGSAKFYIQVALSLDSQQKTMQEKISLVHIPDAFAKILITKTYGLPSYDEEGIFHVSIIDFLLKPELLVDLTL